MTRRRGGNCANTLEVLEQLIDVDTHKKDLNIYLHLLSVFPHRHSDDVRFIRESLQRSHLDPLSIYRDDFQTAASSFIMRNSQTGTRTIVSHSSLPEMTLEEFVTRTDAFDTGDGADMLSTWFHFEVRDPSLTFLEYMEYVLTPESCIGPKRTSYSPVYGAHSIKRLSQAKSH